MVSSPRAALRLHGVITSLSPSETYTVSICDIPTYKSSEHECAMHWAIIERGFQPLIKRKVFIIKKIDSSLNGTQVKSNQKTNLLPKPHITKIKKSIRTFQKTDGSGLSNI